MKKKLEKYCLDVATDTKRVMTYSYKDDDFYYVANEHIVVRLAEPVNGLEVNAHAKKIIEACRIVVTENPDNFNFFRTELPNIEEIKRNIKELVGRRLTKIRFIPDAENVAVNARYLYKAMEIMNTRVCYVASPNMPIILCENDDFMASNRVAICPIHVGQFKRGYKIIE